MSREVGVVDDVDRPRSPARSEKQPNVQLNTRISPEHRRRLDELLQAHPRRRRATLGEVIEDLIDQAYVRLKDPGSTQREMPPPPA